jgi:hypothetical protein
MDNHPAAEIRNTEYTLDDIALRIKEFYCRGCQASEEGAAYFRLTGEWLNKAKGKLAHGKWMEWVERNTPFGHRKANRYMALAATTPGEDLDIQWRIISGNVEPNPGSNAKLDVTSNLDNEVIPDDDPAPPGPDILGRQPTGSTSPAKPLDPNPSSVPFADGSTPTARTRIASALQPVREEITYLRKHLGKDTAQLQCAADALEVSFLVAYGCNRRQR